MTSNNISASWYTGSNQTCYAQAVDQSFLWGAKRPLFEPLPVLFRQIALVVGSNLLFFFVLKRHNQPRIICDLISALVVSPFILEVFSKELSNYIWPSNGNTNLSVLANMGLLYCMFIKGLQMDLAPLTQRQGAKTLFLSFGIILIPFFLGCALYDVFCKDVFSRDRGMVIFVYWGAIVASSSSQILASILAKLKLLSTDIGRDSLCICMINELVSWVLMVVVIAFSSIPHTRDLEAWSWKPVMMVLLFTLLFGFFCYLLIRPCIKYYMIKHYKDEENYDDSIVHFIILVMVCGLVSEFFGANAFLGAFFFGLVIPHGALSQSLEEKMDACVFRLLLPLYFASIGVKMKGIDISIWLKNINLALAATVLKPLCVYLFSIMCSMPHNEGFALAVLQNTKGILSVAVAVIGFDRLHLTKEALSVLILIIILSTVIVGPIMSICYKRVRKNTHPYQQHKSVGGLKPYDDFRVVACIQETQNLPGILNLLEISNNSERSPMYVFGVHLTELIGKASAMLIVHQASGDDSSINDNPFFSKKNAQSNQIVAAFDSFRKNHKGTITVQTLNVLSPMDSMHEDIFNIVEDKQVSMIMLPYHKRQGMDGNLEDGSNIEFRTVNQNVMLTAPCSVGLLIDRSGRTLSTSQAGGSTRKGSNRSSTGEIRTAMLYFGGPDDREALAFAMRLARHSLVNLTLIHFVAGADPSKIEPPVSFCDEENSAVHPIDIESEAEKLIDEEFIRQCLNRRQSEKPIEYREMRSNDGEETIEKLREMDHKSFDLYVVGRGERVYSPMTAGLAEWSENPELGVVGEVLVTSDVITDVSVFVVQLSLDARRANSRSSGVGSSLLDCGDNIRF